MARTIKRVLLSAVSLMIAFSIIHFIIIRIIFIGNSKLQNEIKEWREMYDLMNRENENIFDDYKVDIDKWKDFLLNDSSGTRVNSNETVVIKLRLVHEEIIKFWREKYELVQNNKRSINITTEKEILSSSDIFSTVEGNVVLKEMKERYDNYKKELNLTIQRQKISRSKSKSRNSNNVYNNRNDNNGGDEEKLNIVLLYADDWRHDTLHASNKFLSTPSLNDLASKGIRFTNNCVTSSVCWISRASLQTGQYLSRHKTSKISQAYFLNNWNATYNALLRKNGYYTGFIGKWGFQKNPPPYISESLFDVFKTYDGWHYDKLRKIHITQENERDAIKFLIKRRNINKPFALTVSFYATHAVDHSREQYIPLESSSSLYENISIPIAESAESWKRMPNFFSEWNEGRIRYHWRFDSPEKYQTMMKNYYRMATDVDTACGRIIVELERQGILNQTLIIFTADNGLIHGEHGLADKWYPYQESIRVPLIIRDPRMDYNLIGTTNNEFTLNIDLAPTIISGANIRPPKNIMQGDDISIMYRTTDIKDDDVSEKLPWRKDFYYQHPSLSNWNPYWIPASEALVSKRYKYIVWPYFRKEQLFDLHTDPYEEHDLIPSNNNTSNYHIDILVHTMRTRFQDLKQHAAAS